MRLRPHTFERASSKKRPIIALRTDAAPLTPAFEYFLSESQWIEAQAENMESAYAQLLYAIREPEQSAQGTKFGEPVSVAARAARPGRPESRRKRILLAAGIAFVAAILGAILADDFWLRRHDTAAQPTARAMVSTVTAGPMISDKSIAVLPFVDMSEKRDQEYFADGMAEEILDLLARIPGLTVIGRTSSFQFKGKNDDLRIIGKKLGAAYVLEGSVRKSGDRVRVTTQLINAQTGAHQWSDTYDRTFSDVLKMQDEIAAGLVRALQLTLDTDTLQSRPTLRQHGLLQVLFARPLRFQSL